MTSPKIVTVVGARPQFVKAAVLSREMVRLGETDPGSSLHEVMVHTGQHYDHAMSGSFFEDLGLPEPAHHLNVGSGSHARQTAAMLIGLENVLVAERPGCVLLYGDTNSTIAGALAAAKLQCPIAHVEAGLRCHDLAVPEEVNRVVTDRLSTVLYAPSVTAAATLAEEGVPGEVVEVGDVMLDAFLFHRARASTAILDRLDLRPNEFALATIHRASSTASEKTLSDLLRGLSRVASAGLPVVLPLHPRTKAALDRWDVPHVGVRVIDPVGYEDMLALESNARVIATDSGGVQKEAYWAAVPCVTLRPSTEWVETIEAGWNYLVDSDPEEIERAMLQADPPDQRPPLYGDGRAAEAIARHLSEWLKKGP